MGSIDQFLEVDHSIEPTKAKMLERLPAIMERMDAEMAQAFEQFDDCMTAAREAGESFPKVVLCAGCDEYAFDGTVTAFETADGVQGFCRECVSAIKRRSEPRSAPVPVSDLFPSVWSAFDRSASAWNYTPTILTSTSTLLGTPN